MTVYIHRSQHKTSFHHPSMRARDRVYRWDSYGEIQHSPEILIFVFSTQSTDVVAAHFVAASQSLHWDFTHEFSVQRYLALRTHSTCSSEIPLNKKKKKKREFFSRFSEEERELTALRTKKKNQLWILHLRVESTFEDGAVLQYAAVHCRLCVVAAKSQTSENRRRFSARFNLCRFHFSSSVFFFFCLSGRCCFAPIHKAVTSNTPILFFVFSLLLLPSSSSSFLTQSRWMRSPKITMCTRTTSWRNEKTT